MILHLFENLTLSQLLYWASILVGTGLTASGAFVTRHYAKRPVNGERKTLARHDLKIRRIEESTIKPTVDKLNKTIRTWKNT